MQPWEQAAIREILDIAHLLAEGHFETRRALVSRLRISTEAIDILDDSDEAIAWETSSNNITYLQPRLPET